MGDEESYKRKDLVEKIRPAAEDALDQLKIMRSSIRDPHVKQLEVIDFEIEWLCAIIASETISQALAIIGPLQRKEWNQRLRKWQKTGDNANINSIKQLMSHVCEQKETTPFNDPPYAYVIFSDSFEPIHPGTKYERRNVSVADPVPAEWVEKVVEKIRVVINIASEGKKELKKTVPSVAHLFRKALVEKYPKGEITSEEIGKLYNECCDVIGKPHPPTRHFSIGRGASVIKSIPEATVEDTKTGVIVKGCDIYGEPHTTACLKWHFAPDIVNQEKKASTKGKNKKTKEELKKIKDEIVELIRKFVALHKAERSKFPEGLDGNYKFDASLEAKKIKERYHEVAVNIQISTLNAAMRQARYSTGFHFTAHMTSLEPDIKDEGE